MIVGFWHTEKCSFRESTKTMFQDLFNFEFLKIQPLRPVLVEGENVEPLFSVIRLAVKRHVIILKFQILEYEKDNSNFANIQIRNYENLFYF